MSTNNVVRGSQDNRRDDLDSRYGEIGISAVAAALKFKSKANNPAFCRNCLILRSMRDVLEVQLPSCCQRLAGHHYNPNGDPAFPRSHSGASYRVRKHYTAECVAPHRRHRTPRFGCLNPNGAAPEPVDASAAPITQRLRRGGGTRVARGAHRSSIPASHHRTSHHQCSPKSMFLPVIDGGHDALLCT